MPQFSLSTTLRLPVSEPIATHDSLANRRVLGVRARWAAAGGAATLAAMLIAAACVAPDPRGHGTHEQLGLAPCQFRSLTGRACPSCGMTTAWAHLVRGNLTHAIAANIAGALLSGAAIVVAPWLLIAAISGRWPWFAPQLEVIVYAGTLWLALVALDWVRRLVVGA